MKALLEAMDEAFAADDVDRFVELALELGNVDGFEDYVLQFITKGRVEEFKLLHERRVLDLPVIRNRALFTAAQCGTPEARDLGKYILQGYRDVSWDEVLAASRCSKGGYLQLVLLMQRRNPERMAQHRDIDRVLEYIASDAEKNGEKAKGIRH